ncbi:MAG TPA: hypothetical protein VFT16_00215 [Candidatus Saccharimonadales bacterium]|nr:hypothetical protein [Candidatus Saccharimonadales bacterium]
MRSVGAVASEASGQDGRPVGRRLVDGSARRELVEADEPLDVLGLEAAGVRDAAVVVGQLGRGQRHPAVERPDREDDVPVNLEDHGVVIDDGSAGHEVGGVRLEQVADDTRQACYGVKHTGVQDAVVLLDLLDRPSADGLGLPGLVAVDDDAKSGGSADEQQAQNQSEKTHDGILSVVLKYLVYATVAADVHKGTILEPNWPWIPP